MGPIYVCLGVFVGCTGRELGSVVSTVRSATCVVPTRATDTGGAGVPNALLTAAFTGALCTSSTSVASCWAVREVEAPEFAIHALSQEVQRHRALVLLRSCLIDAPVAATATSTMRRMSNLPAPQNGDGVEEVGVAAEPVPAPGTSSFYRLQFEFLYVANQDEGAKIERCD